MYCIAYFDDYRREIEQNIIKANNELEALKIFLKEKGYEYEYEEFNTYSSLYEELPDEVFLSCIKVG